MSPANPDSPHPAHSDPVPDRVPPGEVPTRTVGSWEELNEALFAGSLDRDIGRFRSPFAFRGHADERYSLRTSLVRLNSADPAIEGHLLRNFRKYACREPAAKDIDWDLL